MRVLIGCEESQTICKAFRDRGHEAYSCDIQPTRGNPEWHYQCDIFHAVRLDFWELIILHPDCTALAVSGNGTYAEGKPDHQDRLDSIEWTMKLWRAAVFRCRHVALENPSSVIFPHLRRAGAEIQYIQPWMFGHKEKKRTGFALHGLPFLKETDNVKEQTEALPIKEQQKIWYASPGPNRKRDRSVTYQGVADAIADQWGIL